MNIYDKEITVEELKRKYEHRYQAQGLDNIELFQNAVHGELKWKHATFSVWDSYFFREMHYRSGRSWGKVRGIIIRAGIEKIQHDILKQRAEIKEKTSDYNNSINFNPYVFASFEKTITIGYSFIPTKIQFPINEDTYGMFTDISNDINVELASLYRISVAYVGASFIDLQERSLRFFQRSIEEFKDYMEARLIMLSH